MKTFLQSFDQTFHLTSVISFIGPLDQTFFQETDA